MSDAIRFVLDGEVRELRDVAPTTTVLNWLREAERRCGTKEGCAEGDCGACTVVIGESDGERMHYRAVNSCIQFLPTLDGKELVTVESLKDGRKLHPVQRAMIECHGSQCGFCTPGFVMSLFALYHTTKGTERDTIDDALAGNLCRCTGYRPIVSAARRMREFGNRDRFHTDAQKTAARLAAIRRRGTFVLEKDGQRYFAPTDLDEFADLVTRYPDAILLGGGTDVGLWVTKQHRRLDTVIYTGDVSALRRIVVNSQFIEIGGGATYSDAHTALAADYPDFGEMLRRLGSVQVRNLGTVGGNIGNASPIGDTPPLLLALDATLELRCGNTAREVPIDGFFIDYRKTALRRGEFISAIRVPRARADTDFRAYKISKRFDQDISAVCGAFAITVAGGRVTQIRIGLGGMAAVPKRAAHAESALQSQPWNEATARGAMRAMANDFQPLTDMRASADYRLKVAQNLLFKFFQETAHKPGATRVIKRNEAA